MCVGTRYGTQGTCVTISGEVFMSRRNGPFKRTLLTIVAVATGGGAVMMFSDKVGYSIDLPVWRSELVRVASPSLQDLLLRKERRLWEIESVVTHSENQGYPVASKLIDERNLLRREVADLSQRVKTLQAH
jgi:hypothetical protein